MLYTTDILSTLDTVNYLEEWVAKRAILLNYF